MFREPCLNALWYYQEGINELLYMVSAIEPIPESVLDCLSSCSGWNIVRSLQPEDASTLTFYSSRIKEIAFGGVPRMNLQQRSSFATSFSETVIFPRLRVLLWSSASGDYHLDFVLRTAGNKLTEIVGAVAYGKSPKLMAMVEKRLPDLTHFWLWDCEVTEDTDAATTRFFRNVLPSAKNLQELHLDTAVAEKYFSIWDTIQFLPHLRKLVLKWYNVKHVLPAVPLSLTTYGILTALTVVIREAPFLCHILNKLSFPNLREFRVRILWAEDKPDEDIPHIRGILRSVVSASAHSRLTSLVVEYGEDTIAESTVEELGTATEFLRLDDLRPLMAKYARLEVLDLRLRCSWALTDDAIEEIVRVWGPHLKVFRLDPDGGWPPASCVTFKGLQHIAQHCPTPHHSRSPLCWYSTRRHPSCYGHHAG
ncbi:hypothetical protein EIP91_003762 [Steccherinum ochraceum]|uniref:F-box domain-containing protein n=1 Tax=Steccherinum ochraceum TaxID=92696 RepID=A0A4R0RIH3_9APHY|nr:hypothetical protein EIP91_003762 [Steccherinum ochraceum]